MHDKAKAGDLRVVNGSEAQKKPSKRGRWDQAGGEVPAKKPAKSSWDAAEASTPSMSRWDETPGRAKGLLSHVIGHVRVCYIWGDI